MATQVIMPQLGESVVEGTVGRWLVTEGQEVKQYDPLLAVTTDKVDTEISAPASGLLLKIYIAEGETVAAGTVLAMIGAAGEAVPETPPAAPGGHHAAGSETTQAAEAADSGAGNTGAESGEAGGPAGPPVAPAAIPPAVTPVAQRVAQEHGVDLAAVTGTGPGGRITKEDVEAHVVGETGRVESGARAVQAAADTGPAAIGFISPAVARLAAQYQIDLSRVPGTGEGGRVTKKDVLAFVAGQRGAAAPAAAPAAGESSELPAWELPGTGSLFKPTEEMGAGQVSGEPAAGHAAPPQAPQPRAVPGGGTQGAQAVATQASAQEPGQAKPRPIAAAQQGMDGEVRPLSAIRRSIARHMALSKRTSPHVTTVMEADLTRVVIAREHLKPEYERQGTRLTFTPFFIQAIVAALKAVPEANSSFLQNEAGGDGESLLLHRRINIGMAVAISDGLIVPVIRDADEKSLLGLARAVNDLADRARSRRLAAEEVQGGTFTLTNHGTAGSLFATPIINQPQAGILGVGAVQKRPVVISRSTSLLPGPDDYLAIRPMVYLSFTFDHRILDGQGADGFLAAVKGFLEGYSA